MLFFKGKDDMGLEASLKLLDLTPDATVDDANQSYAYLHRMIDLFYRDTERPEDGNLQEDMDLLTCAYEKAVAYLSDPMAEREAPADGPRPSSTTSPTDLHFTINFGDDGTPSAPDDRSASLPAPNAQTVREAIDITRRQLREIEATLPQAHQVVESATAAVAAAHQRHEQARTARVNAMVNAKAARTRALLLEVDARRAMAEAIAVAEKARDRVTAARASAQKAGAAAQQARQQADEVKKSEETAAAEAICAEDRLEQARSRLNDMTLKMVEIRKRMSLFREAGADDDGPAVAVDAPATAASLEPVEAADSATAADRKQIMDDLLAIEASLQHRDRPPRPAPDMALPPAVEDPGEKRRHPRIVYPGDQRPCFVVDGRSFPVLDLSRSGMRLMADDALCHPRILRGTLPLGSGQPVSVTGRVIRHDDSGYGVRLVTRLGDHLLTQERRRLGA